MTDLFRLYIPTAGVYELLARAIGFRTSNTYSSVLHSTVVPATRDTAKHLSAWIAAGSKSGIRKARANRQANLEETYFYEIESRN